MKGGADFVACRNVRESLIKRKYKQTFRPITFLKGETKL